MSASVAHKHSPDLSSTDRSPRTQRRARQGETKSRVGPASNGAVGAGREKRTPTGSRAVSRTSSAGSTGSRRSSTARPPSTSEAAKTDIPGSKTGSSVKVSSGDDSKPKRSLSKDDKSSTTPVKKASVSNAHSDEGRLKKTSPLVSRKMSSSATRPPSNGSSREEMKQKRTSPGTIRKQSATAKTASSSSGGGGGTGGKATGTPIRSTSGKDAGSKERKQGATEKSGKSEKDRDLKDADQVGVRVDAAKNEDEKTEKEKKNNEKKIKTESADGRNSTMEKKPENKQNGPEGESTSTEKPRNEAMESQEKEKKVSSGKAPGKGGNSPGRERKAAGERRATGGGMGAGSPGRERKATVGKRPSIAGDTQGKERRASNEKRVSCNTDGSAKSCKFSAPEHKPSSPRLGRSPLTNAGTSASTNEGKRAGVSSLDRKTASGALLSSSRAPPCSSRAPSSSSQAPPSSSIASSKTLSGKVITLDPEHLKEDARVLSTLKLFGVKGGVGSRPTVHKMSKGTIIKSVGVGTMSGTKNPTVRKVGGAAGVRQVTRTGSVATLNKKSSPKMSPKINEPRKRIRSSEDLLKDSHAPSSLEAAVTAKVGGQTSLSDRVHKTSNVRSQAAVPSKSGPRDQQRVSSIPPSSAKTRAAERKTEGPARVNSAATSRAAGKGMGILTRPSCRGTQVKSRIALWSEKEKEVEGMKRSVSPLMSVPASRITSATSLHRSPSLSASPSPRISPRSSPHLSPYPSSPQPSPNHSPSHSPSRLSATPSPQPSPKSSSLPPSPSHSPSQLSRSRSPSKDSPSKASPTPYHPPLPPKPSLSLSAIKSSPPRPSPSRSSHSPSPRISPSASPRALRRRTPVKTRPATSPLHDPTTSRRGSKGRSLSPDQQLKKTELNAKEEQQAGENDVYDDIAVLSSKEKDVKKPPTESNIHDIAVPSYKEKVTEKLVTEDDVYEDIVGVKKSDGKKPATEDDVYDDIAAVSSKERDGVKPASAGSGGVAVPNTCDEIYEDVAPPILERSKLGIKETGEKVLNGGDSLLAPVEDVYEDTALLPPHLAALSSSSAATDGEDESHSHTSASANKPPTPIQETCAVEEQSATETAPAVQEDNIYTTIPEIYTNYPKFVDTRNPPDLPPRPLTPKDNQQNHDTDLPSRPEEVVEEIYDEIRPSHQQKKPDLEHSYALVQVIEETSEHSDVHTDAKVVQKADSLDIPKNRRNWLRSPLFNRRRHSDGKEQQTEGGSSDQEIISQKKDDGFIKKLGKLGSRGSKKKKSNKKRKSTLFDSFDSSHSFSITSKTSSDNSDSEEGSSSDVSSTSPAVQPRDKAPLPADVSEREPVIVRSRSFSPSPDLEVEYVIASRKRLDPRSQRVVSDSAVDPSTESPASGAGGKESECGVGTAQFESEIGAKARVSHASKLKSKTSAIRKTASLSARSTKIHRTEGGKNLSHDILAIIESMKGSELLEQYQKKLSPPPPEGGSGSAPGTSRLIPPVLFQLKNSSSHPNLVTVGFDVPETVKKSSHSASSSPLPNGVSVVRRQGLVREQASDSSTGTDEEETPPRELGEGEGEREGEEMAVVDMEESQSCPIESSLDSTVASRYELKRKLSENASRGMKVLPGSGGAPTENMKGNEENLIATFLMYADAVWDRVSLESDELSFRVGDVIEILDMSDDLWWQGSVSDHAGWFPSSFVRLRIAQEGEDEVAELPRIKGNTLPRATSRSIAAEDSSYRQQSTRRRMTIRRKDSYPSLPRKLTPSEVRAKVIEEILNTERDYVKNLEDIIEGFLKKCRQNVQLFDQRKIETIFCNVEAVYLFQKDFLRELESRVQHHCVEDSQIGDIFVASREEFTIYAEYCNNHPHAVSEMSSLQQKQQYAIFFESCRLLRNLQNISLEGFLLTPVQKICKYPLQLTELLKYTGEDHPDRPHVEAAVAAMKQVALHINEQKRRMENIGKIGKWQEGIENWKGPHILETSTEMIHSSELHKISKGHSQERHFFLFDHQLIYCKKETIGAKLSYKGRLATMTCIITDLPDGAETHNGSAVRNAWKMSNQVKGKVYVIFAKTPETKQKWMEAFLRERERVREDKEKGFNVSLRMKRAAAALSHNTPRVAAAKRIKSFSKKQPFRIQTLSESIDSSLKVKMDNSLPRDKKGSGGISLIKKLNF